jgi:hypothetical protein
MTHHVRTTSVWLLGCSLLSCSGGTVVPQPEAAPNPCVMDLGAPAPQLRVALTHLVDPQRAPVPANASERLLFSQLYQSLVEVDCRGEVLPELAESWTMLENGRVWEFRLRAGPRLWDGTAVTPHTVMQSWAERSLSIMGMYAMGERVLRVELSSPAADVRSFADPAFAIARRIPGRPWPIGSGAFHVDTASMPGTVRITSGQRVIDFVRVQTADARSALDARMDAVITQEAAAVAYAEASAAYVAAPLPWSRTYVLVSSGSASADSPLTREVFELTRDAVRADVRAAQPPFWWSDPVCQDGAGIASAVAVQRAVIAYPRGDAVAQGIAERIAAVSWPISRAPEWLRRLLPPNYPALGAPTAVGLDETTLQSWLRWQRAMALVISVPRSMPADCRLLMLPNEGAITPILDVREHLIHRRNLGRIAVLGGGTVRFLTGQP